MIFICGLSRFRRKDLNEMGSDEPYEYLIQISEEQAKDFDYNDDRDTNDGIINTPTNSALTMNSSSYGATFASMASTSRNVYVLNSILNITFLRYIYTHGSGGRNYRDS